MKSVIGYTWSTVYLDYSSVFLYVFLYHDEIFSNSTLEQNESFLKFVTTIFELSYPKDSAIIRDENPLVNSYRLYQSYSIQNIPQSPRSQKTTLLFASSLRFPPPIFFSTAKDPYVALRKITDKIYLLARRMWFVWKSCYLSLHGYNSGMKNYVLQNAIFILDLRNKFNNEWRFMNYLVWSWICTRFGNRWFWKMKKLLNWKDFSGKADASQKHPVY